MSAQPLNVLVDHGAALDGPRPTPWQAGSPWLARRADLQVCWLDRGFDGLTSGLSTIPYPSHHRSGCAADSLLLQQLCEQRGIDLFISAGPATPVSTPSICLVDESSLAPGEAHRSQAGPNDLAWRFACRLLCANEAVRQRLLMLQPDLKPQRAVVAALNWQAEPAATWVPAWCDDLARLGREVQCEVQAGLWQPFFAEWTRLRRLQWAVDV